MSPHSHQQYTVRCFESLSEVGNYSQFTLKYLLLKKDLLWEKFQLKNNCIVPIDHHLVIPIWNHGQSYFIYILPSYSCPHETLTLHSSSPVPWYPPDDFLSWWFLLLGPCIRPVIRHLSFCAWLISRSIVLSRFMHVVAGVGISKTK